MSIKAHNAEFEAKVIDMSTQFTHPKYRLEYMAKPPEMVKRITIFEVAVLYRH